MELRQEQDINNQHIDILIELEEHLSQLQCKVSRVWNPWKTCKSCTKIVIRVSPKLLSLMWKIRKLYIEKLVWRRQEETCNAVTSPPKLFSDCLDLHLTPSCDNHFQAVMTFTLDALLRDAVKSVLDHHGILLLTPSGCYSWRRHLLFPAWKIKTLAFSSLLCSKNVRIASFSRFHSQST